MLISPMDGSLRLVESTSPVWHIDAVRGAQRSNPASRIQELDCFLASLLAMARKGLAVQNGRILKQLRPALARDVLVPQDFIQRDHRSLGGGRLVRHVDDLHAAVYFAGRGPRVLGVGLRV